MAIGTGIMLAASTAIGVAGGIAKEEEGRRMKRAGEKALSEYERQELDNVYAGMEVPMAGYEMRKDQINQDLANQSDMASKAGARGVIGSVSMLQQYSQQGLRQIGVDLEQSEFSLKRMIAEDDARIRQMKEEREKQDLAGIGAQIEAGRQTQMSGVGDVQQSITGGAQVLGSGLLTSGATTGSVNSSLDRVNTPGAFDEFSNMYNGESLSSLNSRYGTK